MNNENEKEYTSQQKEQAERAEIENRVRKHLTYGEQLLWCGKQQSGVPTNMPFWVKATLFLTIFIIMYYVVFGFFRIFSKIIPLIASAVVSVILYITLPKLFSELASEMNCTPNIYAITNKRILTSYGRGMLSEDLKNIKYVRYFQSENGIGNVYYSNYRDFKVTKSGAISVIGVSRRRNDLEIQALYNIDNPQEVCEILQNAVKGCADISYYSNSEPIHKAPAAEPTTSQNIPPRYSYSEYSDEFFETTKFDENILWTGYVNNNSYLNTIFAIFIGFLAFIMCIMLTAITKAAFAVIMALAILAAVIYGIFKVINESKLLVAITDSRLLIKKKNGKFTSVNLESIHSIDCVNKTVFIKRLHKRTEINFSREIQNENLNRTVSKPHADYIFKIENGAEEFYNTLLGLTSKQPY